MSSKTFDSAKVEAGAEMLLEGMGIDWKNDENFKETPQRVARAFKEFTIGLYDEFTNIKKFKSKYTGIIFFKSIRAIGLCPHHLLPIYYDVAFAYSPNGEVLGLSKIARIIKHLAAKPVLQEDMTKDINSYFDKVLKPRGVAVLIKGVHGCMRYRGVREAEEIKTMEFSGIFINGASERGEFFSMLNEKI